MQTSNIKIYINFKYSVINQVMSCVFCMPIPCVYNYMLLHCIVSYHKAICFIVQYIFNQSKACMVFWWYPLFNNFLIRCKRPLLIDIPQFIILSCLSCIDFSGSSNFKYGYLLVYRILFIHSVTGLFVIPKWSPIYYILTIYSMFVYYVNNLQFHVGCLKA